MPAVFTAKLDGSNSVRIFHVPMAAFYLQTAREEACVALRSDDEHQTLKASVIAIALSVMAVEAFLNELSEDVLPATELEDFFWLRKGFKKSAPGSAVKHKLEILGQRKHGAVIPGDIKQEIEELVSLRNALVHYKLSDTAGKVLLPDAKPTVTSEGGYKVAFNFMAQPERIVPPLLHRITPAAAAHSYNAALAVFQFWCKLDGASERLSGFEAIVA